MRTKLTRIWLNGFKSFPYGARPSDTSAPCEADGQDGKVIDFGDVTVLLGANGAGKSNLVSFFRMLNFMTTGALQEFIGRYGGAGSLLHFGPQITPQMQAEVVFADGEKRTTYTMTMASAAPDTLIFTNEAIEFHREGYENPQQVFLGAGHKESQLPAKARDGDRTCQVVFALLRNCRSYQFHDTSETAKIRKSGYIEDSGYLRADAGNLAAYLYAMARRQPEYYGRIVRTVRQVCPQFGDFVLRPSDQSPDYILLNWTERNYPDCLMGPHQLSDGTLRFMALATLFLQPPTELPSVIVIDEPELGLHPNAIAVLAGLIHGVTQRAQVVLATQSETFVNHFDLSQIRPIECRRGASAVLPLAAEEFAEWLEDYTTGELWEKNVFGGGPRYE